MTGMRLCAASRFRRRGASRDQVPGIPCRPHQRCGDRPPCHRRGQARHGRHDARPHRRSAYRRARSRKAREPEIRPCVGATYCLDRIYEGHDALCIHNPATGREATMPHVVARSRPGQPAGRWWSAPARPASKRRGSPPSAAMRYPLRGSRASPAARSASPSR